MNYDDIILFADEILSRKDPYNHHGVNVSRISLMIAERTNMTEADKQLLNYASRLHDVGKILIEDILLNTPRRLTSGEYEKVKTHAKLGYEILTSMGCHSDLCKIVYAHQEHWDGTGYPNNLKGEEIPYAARVITIADVWDAITNDRAYRKGMSFEKALYEMNRVSSKWFDPKLYAIFLDIFRIDESNGVQIT